MRCLREIHRKTVTFPTWCTFCQNKKFRPLLYQPLASAAKSKFTAHASVFEARSKIYGEALFSDTICIVMHKQNDRTMFLCFRNMQTMKRAGFFYNFGRLKELPPRGRKTFDLCQWMFLVPKSDVTLASSPCKHSLSLGTSTPCREYLWILARVKRPLWVTFSFRIGYLKVSRLWKPLVSLEKTIS